MDKKDKASIFGMIFICVCVFMMMITLLFLSTKNQELEKKLEFDYIREGKCVYIETEKITSRPRHYYCLVYDEETEKTLKAIIPKELDPYTLEVGEIIIYKVNYDYTEVTFLNVKN